MRKYIAELLERQATNRGNDDVRPMEVNALSSCGICGGTSHETSRCFKNPNNQNQNHRQNQDYRTNNNYYDNNKHNHYNHHSSKGYSSTQAQPWLGWKGASGGGVPGGKGAKGKGSGKGAPVKGVNGGGVVAQGKAGGKGEKGKGKVNGKGKGKIFAMDEEPVLEETREEVWPQEDWIPEDGGQADWSHEEWSQELWSQEDWTREDEELGSLPLCSTAASETFGAIVQGFRQLWILLDSGAGRSVAPTWFGQGPTTPSSKCFKTAAGQRVSSSGVRVVDMFASSSKKLAVPFELINEVDRPIVALSDIYLLGGRIMGEYVVFNESERMDLYMWSGCLYVELWVREADVQRWLQEIENRLSTIHDVTTTNATTTTITQPRPTMTNNDEQRRATKTNHDDQLPTKRDDDKSELHRRTQQILTFQDVDLDSFALDEDVEEAEEKEEREQERGSAFSYRKSVFHRPR